MSEQEPRPDSEATESIEEREQLASGLPWLKIITGIVGVVIAATILGYLWSLGLIGCITLLVLAWRKPAMVERLTTYPRLNRIPAAIRATPMRFAIVAAAILIPISSIAGSVIYSPEAVEEGAPVQAESAVDTPEPTRTTELTAMSEPESKATSAPEPMPTVEPELASSSSPTDLLRSEAAEYCPEEFRGLCMEHYIGFASGDTPAALCTMSTGQWFFETPNGHVGDACAGEPSAQIVVIVGESPASSSTTPTENSSDPALAGPELVEARVVSVVDGDTVQVVYNGAETTVRIIGVDTPDTVQCYGLEASVTTQELISRAGDVVLLEKDVSETDQYSQLLRYVWLEHPDGRRMLNYELVAQGHAQVSTSPPDVKYHDMFLAAQHEAREQNRGLWGGTCSTFGAP